MPCQSRTIFFQVFFLGFVIIIPWYYNNETNLPTRKPCTLVRGGRHLPYQGDGTPIYRGRVGSRQNKVFNLHAEFPVSSATGMNAV